VVITFTALCTASFAGIISIILLILYSISEVQAEIDVIIGLSSLAIIGICSAIVLKYKYYGLYRRVLRLCPISDPDHMSAG
jgi:hypothetical protein